MPWIHRGLLALITGKTAFLLDFGPEQWKLETSAWTPADLQKILTNFITERGEPLFELDISGEAPEIRITQTKSKFAFILPRGYSKTTVMNLANLIGVCFKASDFLLYVSEAAGHASNQLSTIKKELEENDLIRLAFGDLKADRQSSNKWTEDVIEPTNGVMVAVAGRGGQIRGKSKRAIRPKRIICDDLQDEDSVDSDTQLDKDSRWYFRTLEPALAKGGKIFVIGTLLAGGDKPILNKLLINDDYTCVRFGAVDRQGEAVWDSPFGNGMSLAELEHKREIAASMGELSGHYLEYESKYVSDNTKVFPRNKLIRVSKGIERFVAISLCVDPAISESKKADFCAFGVVGMEAGGQKHVIDVYAKKGMPPEDQVDKFFELHWLYMTHLSPEFAKHGVESIAYQRALAMAIRSEQFRRSRLPISAGPLLGQIAGTKAYFEIEEIKHGTTGKDQRIKGILKPIYHSGYLTFERAVPDLESQLFSYPDGKKDIPDVVAMCVKQLDPFSALHVVDEDGSDLTKDQAEPLPADFGRFAS
jgi:hypothetical protein